MEIKSAENTILKQVRFYLSICTILMVLHMKLCAQPPVKVYTVKKGKMYIELSKHLSEAALDSFISQYELQDLAIKQFVKTNFLDSIIRLGWELEKNTKDAFIISKPLAGYDKLNNPADRIKFTEKERSFAERFPVVSSKVQYGYNRFRNKNAFLVRDSIVTFFLRGRNSAWQVMLAGSFNDWNPHALPMLKKDSGWIAYVKIRPGKYWYKFIVDGGWTTDDDNQLRESDEFGNINSVYFKTNFVFAVNAFPDAKKVFLAGSFNDWRPRDLQMNKTQSGWELPIYLADGTHTYKYVVDGTWYTDPGNKERFPNEFNDFNSVLRIGKPYIFKLDGYTNAKQVVLSGSFNKWRKDELFMKKTATGWELPYTLGPGNYEYNFIIDGKEVVRPKHSGIANNPDNKENPYFIIDANYTFRLKGFNNAKKVFLAGDFNEWNPGTLAMTREGDEWVFRVNLGPGKHLYKFIVDGRWILDPANRLWEADGRGNNNSVIWIENRRYSSLFRRVPHPTL